MSVEAPLVSLEGPVASMSGNDGASALASPTAVSQMGLDRSLGRMTVAGMVWTLLQSAGGRAVGFLAQLVIAAILTPSDFGLIGLTYTVSAAGGLFISFGIDSVLVQRHRTLHLWEAPAFWCTFALGLLGFALVMVISPIAARIYHAPGIPLLAAVIALSTPCTALQAVPLVLLRARFEFRKLAIINFVEILGIQGLTVTLALAGFGAMSFAIPLLITAIIKSVALWLIAPANLRGGLASVRRFKYLFGSSAAVFGTAMLQALIAQGDYITLGLFGAPAVIGAYFFAFKMASQPVLLMATSLTGVLLPALSKLRHTRREQGAAAIRAAKIVGLVVMPAGFLQAALTEPVIHLFFASKWDASIPLMQILSIGLGLDAITWVGAALLTSRGGFRQQFIYVVCSAPVFFALVISGAWLDSAEGVAVGVALYYLLTSPVVSWIVFCRDGLSAWRLSVVYLAPAVLSAVAVGCAIVVDNFIGFRGNLLQIAIMTLLTGVFYTTLLRITDAAAFRDLLSLVSGVLKR